MYKVKDRNLILYCSTLLNVGIRPIIVPLIFIWAICPKQKTKALSFRKTQRFLFYISAELVVAKPVDSDCANRKIYILWPAPPLPKIKDFGDPVLRNSAAQRGVILSTDVS